MITKILDMMEELEQTNKSTAIQRALVFILPIVGITAWLWIMPLLMQTTMGNALSAFVILSVALFLLWCVYVILRRIISYIIFDDSFELVVRQSYMQKAYRSEDYSAEIIYWGEDIVFNCLWLIFLTFFLITPIFGICYAIWYLAGRSKN